MSSSGQTGAGEHRRVIMSMERYYWIYILASAIGGTLYIGATNNLVRRVYEHKIGLADGFTTKYRMHRLVYFEQYSDVEAAILREKRLKKWNRAWKIRPIEELNPKLGRPLSVNCPAVSCFASRRPFS